MNPAAASLFLLAAFALLGSPGPGIAALVAVTRCNGLRAGLRYYAGLQLGLALAAGVSAGGLLSLLAAFPFLLRLSSICAAIYLVYLAFKIGTAPVQSPDEQNRTGPSTLSGFILGLTNPKAYLAFGTLMACYTLLPDRPTADAFMKWALIVGVVILVDLAWLLVGAALHRATLAPRIERMMNVAFAATILIAAVAALA